MNKNLYIFAAILTTIVFLFGVFLGIEINVQQSEVLKEEFKEIDMMIKSANLNEILYDLNIRNETCNLSSRIVEKLANDSYATGIKVEKFEKSKKIDIPTYKNLKKEYTLMQTQHYIFTRKLKERCSFDYPIILYFYNSKCNKCNDQGMILTDLKRKYVNDLMVFSFDADLDLSTIDAFKKIYNIEEFPTLIINEKKYGFMTNIEIEEIL